MLNFFSDCISSQVGNSDDDEDDDNDERYDNVEVYSSQKIFMPYPPYHPDLHPATSSYYHPLVTGGLTTYIDLTRFNVSVQLISKMY